jgi:hypothetical protein
MRIAIIGIINHDTIAMANGQELQDLGGILYNTAVLANMVDEQTSLFPVTRIGEDCYDMMTNILASYPNVDLCGVAIAPEGTSCNTIRYDASMEKVERLTNHIGSIPFDQIEPFLNHDAILINFIIGDDISRETMRGYAPGLRVSSTSMCTICAWGLMSRATVSIERRTAGMNGWNGSM